MVKHASIIPQCGITFEDIFIAGALVGLYTNMFISGTQASELVPDKRIKWVSLSGGEVAGKSIAAEAGKQLKKAVQELGESDAFIVLWCRDG